MSRRARTAAGLALWLAAAGLSCNALEGRLKTCRDLRVDLVNALASEGPVHIAIEGEALSATTLLPAVPGGSTRSIEVCVERGDRKKFRAAYGDRVVANATCVVSHATEELQSATARVIWSNQGLLCEGW